MAARSPSPDAESQGGYPTDWFVASVDDLKDREVVCSICTEVMRDATETECGHAFCGSCVHGLEKCPMCRKRIQKDLLNVSVTFNRSIRALKVKCPEVQAGCAWQG